jgi:hypothetical protein
MSALHEDVLNREVNMHEFRNYKVVIFEGYANIFKIVPIMLCV